MQAVAAYLCGLRHVAQRPGAGGVTEGEGLVQNIRLARDAHDQRQLLTALLGNLSGKETIVPEHMHGKWVLLLQSLHASKGKGSWEKAL